MPPVRTAHLPASSRKLQFPATNRCLQPPLDAKPEPRGRANLSFHGKRVCPHGQTGKRLCGALRIAEGTLLFSDLGLTNVREEAGMGRAALSVVLAGFIQAEAAVHSQADFAGGVVLLAIVLPPADRAQRQRAGGLQRLTSAAWTAKTRFHHLPRMNGRGRRPGSLHGGWLSAAIASSECRGPKAMHSNRRDPKAGLPAMPRGIHLSSWGGGCCAESGICLLAGLQLKPGFRSSDHCARPEAGQAICLLQRIFTPLER